MDVVPLGVAVVEADQDAVLDVVGDADDLDAGLLERRQRALRAGDDVDAVEQEILVAALVVDEQDLLAVGRPEILPDRALGLGGQRPRRLAGRRPARPRC